MDLRRDPTATAWYLRAILLRGSHGAFVGLTGFHGPPEADGSVELGYEIEPAYRRQGYAVEATTGLVDWAFQQPGIRCVRAAIREDNVASLGVIRKAGFTPAGTSWDVDELGQSEGIALLFERHAGARAKIAPTEPGREPG